MLKAFAPRWKKRIVFAAALWISIAASLCAEDSAANAHIAVPEALRIIGVPPIPKSQLQEAGKYTRLGGASFRGWHPEERAMLISSKNGETTQLSLLATPGGKRTRLTRGQEPVSTGRVLVRDGATVLVYQHDKGGDEHFQLTALDLKTKTERLLTDGTSRNTGQRVSHDGRWIAYTSTRRNGRDTDVFISKTDGSETRLLVRADSPGWSIYDWSPNDDSLLAGKSSSRSWQLVSIADGASRKITKPVSSNHSRVRIAENGKALYALADVGDSARRALVRIDLKTGKQTVLSARSRWDVESYAISADAGTVAYVLNEDGFSVLRLLDVSKKRELPAPKLPAAGVISDMEWHPKFHELGFTLTSAQASADAYSITLESGALTRWTTRTGNSTLSFAEPGLIHVKSFDGLEISALVYRPDAQKFPGPRPVVVSFHGGPEGKSRPGFLGANNYFINELGIALVYPNVRGSTGYGRAFMRLDDKTKREDAVKDAGAIFEWIRKDNGLDAARIGVMGGSYGGYMTLATLVRYNDLLRCGVDNVGISNFVTFLESTADYRRDQRRKEYGDERDETMRAFLEKISPANNVEKIRAPLFIIQGENDPRVALSESETMRERILKRNGTVWYLGAANEGHGFKKRSNNDYQFHATLLFFKKYLLDAEP